MRPRSTSLGSLSALPPRGPRPPHALFPGDGRAPAAGLAHGLFGTELGAPRKEFLGGGGILSIVLLPQPECTTEAHMGGIAFLPSATTPGQDPDCDVRYFTLEKGFSDTDAPRTTLCEWRRTDDDISHLNYGDGPAPTATAFARAILSHLPQSSSWQDEAEKLS